MILTGVPMVTMSEKLGGVSGVHPDTSVAAKMIDAAWRDGRMNANLVAVQTNPIFSQRIVGTGRNFGSDPFALFCHLTLNRFRYRPDRVDLHPRHGEVTPRSLSARATRRHRVNSTKGTAFKEKQQALGYTN